VDAGSLKLADEKRALQEINQTKRIRRTVEGFQAESDAIDADRAAVEELKKQLDDPEAKAISERYDNNRLTHSSWSDASQSRGTARLMSGTT